MDRQKLQEIIRNTNKKYGKNTLFTLGKNVDRNIKRASTGIDDLDAIIGGGLPVGRIIELFGVESAGKTSLAFHLASQFDMVLFVDMEGFDSSLAKSFGNRKGQFIIRRPTWGEQALEVMLDFAEAGCPLIILDSVPAMIPRREYESNDMDKHAGIAMVAGLLSRKLPKLLSVIEKNESTVVFINQVRDKFGGMPWGDPYTTPGGRALKHLASLRIQIARKSWIKISDRNYGQICKVRVVKSKVCAPMKEAELPLVFKRGFIEHDKIKLVVREMRKLELNK